MVRFLKALRANGLLLMMIMLCYALFIAIGVTVDAEPHRPKPIDVVFVFDTTNSMQPRIDDLLKISSRFASELGSYGDEHRLAMVCFGALSDKNVIREVFRYSSDVEAFQNFLSGIKAHGGGKEDQITAIRHAIGAIESRPKAHKVLILITDEPLYGNESKGKELPLDEWAKMADEVEAAGFTAYTVSTDDPYYRELAAQTGGSFYDIFSKNDFTTLLLDIATDINASLTR